MDDIEYLLHLEALKRYSDDTRNIYRQVEEHARNCMVATYKYKRLYARLAKLLKHVCTRHALDLKPCINASQVERTAFEVDRMSKKISSDSLLVRLSEEIIEECKELLETEHKPRNLLAKQQRNFAECCDAFKAVRTLLESVENAMETATIQNMDQLVTEVQPQTTHTNNTSIDDQ